jgi:hypothetical protein
MDTPELDHLIGNQTWVTDSMGATMHHSELAEVIKAEIVTDDEDVLIGLIAKIQADSRKSFSKKKIIELIEEWT